MQNIGVPPTTLTDDETLDLAKVGTTKSSGHFQRTAAATPNVNASTSGKSLSANRECVQSDPETRRKSKARSRFTSALRKLSGRKKYNISKDTSTESSLAGGPSCEIVSAPETVLSSGGEDTGDTNATASPDAKPKKKSKLAKRFLLGGLKKSKTSSTKKSIDEDEEGDLVQCSQEEIPAEDADAIDDAHLPDDELEEHKKRKVTISLTDTQQSTTRELKEAEVDEKQLTDETNVTAVTGAPSETDYLTPIEDKTQPSAYESVGGCDVVQTPVTITEDKSALASPTKSAPDQKQKKKKLKTKKSTLKEAAVTIIKTTATTSGSTVPTSTPKLTAATVQKTSTTRTTTITTDEKFVITQSTRDTPPSERAPAKPSRVVTTAQPPTADPTTASTGAVRKSSTRAADTLNSPSPRREQRSTFGAVSIAAAVAGKRQRTKGGKSPTNQATSRSASNKTSGTVESNSSATAKSSKEAETELMHTSTNPLQRGHRFPKPSPTVLTSFGAKGEASTATSKASASATTPQSASRSNLISKLATPTPVTGETTNEGRVTAIADADTVEENHTKPTNATVALDAPTQNTDTSIATLEAIRKQIQFQLESHASIDKPLQQTEQTQRQEPRPHNQQHQVLVAPQLLVDDTASPPHSLQSNVSLSNYQQPPTYTPSTVPTITSTPLATPTETRSSSHFRHPSSSKVIFPDPGIYSDIYADKSAALLYIADESVTTASSSGADDVVSSAESAQPSDYSGNNIRNTNFPGHALSDDFDLEEQTHGPPLQPTVRFAVGSVVRPLATSFDSPLHDHSSYDSNPSSDSHSESSRRRIRYISQPLTFDEDFESIQQRHQKLKYKKTAGSEYSVDSEYDSGDNQMPAFGDLTMEQDIEPTIMTSANTEKREHLYKILVIGELGTGKTSFIKRYVHQFFSQNYRATIGVDFALKVLHWDPNTTVRLQLWDIAGQERFGNMTRVYYKEAVGAFIVFDVTRSGTFDCVSKWKDDLDSKVQLPDGSPIPCILLANKCDQEKQGIVTSPEKMDEYVRENGFAGWYETSAKENINIDEAARALVNKILLNDKLISAADLADSEKFNLNNSAEQSSSESKGKCSC
ncbi:uncharacterized protein Rab32 isoform X1 [Bactrocera oleae]|uniref:uncharacterized protein Rab32 isoform X1 n=1 Tax=Bactrocera oleae TaxID=104688 RepID=UPI00387E7329